MGYAYLFYFVPQLFFQIKRFSEILQSVWSRASKTLNFSKHEIWNKKISIMIIVFEDHFQENPAKNFPNKKHKIPLFDPFCQSMSKTNILSNNSRTFLRHLLWDCFGLNTRKNEISAKIRSSFLRCKNNVVSFTKLEKH